MGTPELLPGLLPRGKLMPTDWVPLLRVQFGTSSIIAPAWTETRTQPGEPRMDSVLLSLGGWWVLVLGRILTAGLGSYFYTQIS